MRKFNKITRVTALLLLFSFLLLPAVFADTIEALAEDNVPHTDSVKATAVYNIENDMVVYSHNADTVLPTASFTKMMTAVCAYELLSQKLDQELTVEYSMIKDATGNRVGYYVGETVTVRDMFGGLLTRGANDSAYLLCYAAKGNVEEFLAFMNNKAKALGMENTTYKNPTGMDAEGMVTTAADSLKIAYEFYKNDFLTELSSAVKYDMPANNRAGERIIYNRNALVSRVIETGYFDSRIVGLNAGSTASAGYYAASALPGETLSYIIVVLGGETVEEKNMAYTTTSALATYAKNGYGYVEVIKTSKPICEIPVRLSTDADYVTLVPANSLTLYLPASVDINKDLVYTYRLATDSLNAPVTEGETVGTYTVSKDGEILGSVDLVTKNSLDKSDFLVVLDGIERFTTSVFFVTTLIAAAVLTVVYFIINALLRVRRRKRNYRRR